MELGQLLTRSVLTQPEIYSLVSVDLFFPFGPQENVLNKVQVMTTNNTSTSFDTGVPSLGMYRTQQCTEHGSVFNTLPLLK
jgi:hypothetical protein